MIKKIVIDKANRLYQLPPNIFSFRDDKSKAGLTKKIKTVDIGSFAWPVPFTREKLDSTSFASASRESIEELKGLLAEWFYNRDKIKLNSKKEIFIGSGISGLLFELMTAFVDPGDVVFVPELSIPLYKKAITTAGGESIHYEINHKHNWQPNFERVSSRLGRVSRMLILNNPHNPTGTTISEKELEQLIWTAAKENILIINDAAYQSISGQHIPSLIGIPQAKKVGVELYSFAYNFGLPPLPFGFAVGNREIINGLKQVERLTTDYIPLYFIKLAIDAIRQYPNEQLLSVRKLFKKNALLLQPVLDLLELDQSGFDTIPFLWAKIERRKNAVNQASQLYRRSRVLVAPGSAFGDTGEGFLRFSLTADPETYQQAHERIKKKLRLLRPKEES